jgi:predicted phosphodiesterase
MSITKIFIFGDVHAPYHDKKAVSCMLKCMDVFKPDIVVDEGDFWDCYAVSKFKKDPRRKTRLVDEVELGEPVLRDIESAAGKAELKRCKGNHEVRLDALLEQPSHQSLHGAVSLEGLCDMSKWQITEYEDYFKLGKVIYTHDLGHSGVTANRLSLSAASHSVVIGHTHRMGSVVEGDLRGKHRVCHSFGWLGDVKKVDYMHKLKVARNWCHGFGVGHMAPDGTTWFSGIPIIRGKALVNEKIIEG